MTDTTAPEGLDIISADIAASAAIFTRMAELCTDENEIARIVMPYGVYRLHRVCEGKGLTHVITIGSNVWVYSDQHIEVLTRLLASRT